MRIACLRLLFASLAGLLAVLCFAAPADAQSCPGAKPGRYKVKIDSAPAGATIYLGSKVCPPIGNTPWSGALNKGEFTVIVESPGYEPAQRMFKVAAVRKVQELFVPLVRRPQIEIRADADPNLIGAAVSVDGQPAGTIQGPLVIPTTAGRHLVEITKQGFQPFQQWVDLTSNPTSLLTPALPKPKTGTIVVDADAPGGEVYLDGNKIPDSTPAVITGVSEGPHVVEVRKPPAPPWKTTVNVEANKQSKVRAELAALLHGGVGVVRVLSEAPGARAVLDGVDMGPVPVDIKDVKAGDHIVQVKATGFATGEKKVTVRAGQSEIVKFDLGADGSQGTLKIVSSVPEAEVFIDGAAIGKVPQEKRLAAGEHLVMVRLQGYKPFEQKVSIEAGKVLPLQAELRAVGRLRIISTPAGARVTINGVPSGKTPFDAEVETGDTVVRIDEDGYASHEQTVRIEGGKTETMSRQLAVAAKSDEEREQERKGLSSFGARVLPRGRSTIDFDAGYPYYVNGRITVGAGRIARQFAFDATIAVRSMGARTDIGLGGRMMLANESPFAAAVFANGWWGSKLLDDSKRNGVTFEGGILASLTALSNVTITGRGYLQLWSDRHCPELQSGNTFDAADPTETCEGYRQTLAGMPSELSDADRVRAEKLTGKSGTGFFDREAGARFLVGVVAEIAMDERWTLYGILEGAPFQDERALFTDLFSGPMFDTDYVLYGRIGLTHKF